MSCETAYDEAAPPTSHHWREDVDGDGDIDSADNASVNAARTKQIHQSGYNVHADFNRNGTVDSTDLADAGPTHYQAALAPGWLSDSPVDNAICYCGYVFNPETLNSTVRFRHYDPRWGRWLSRDPAGYADLMSLYGYVGSSPISTLDPLGLNPLSGPNPFKLPGFGKWFGLNVMVPAAIWFAFNGERVASIVGAFSEAAVTAAVIAAGVIIVLAEYPMALAIAAAIGTVWSVDRRDPRRCGPSENTRCARRGLSLPGVRMWAAR